MVEVPAAIAGEYRLVRAIGEGASGVVYEVEHLATRQGYALKVLRDRALTKNGIERFRREAAVIARLRSEHIVRLVALGPADVKGPPFFLMELLDGVDLWTAAGERRQPPGQVVHWLRQVARALDDMHAAGVVHRDLKPQNVFLHRAQAGRPPVVKLLDFGIAKVLDACAETTHDCVLGTPFFMAPEQVQGPGIATTPRTDLFSLGLLAHWLLAGRHYWQERAFLPLVREVCTGEMPAPSSRGNPCGPAFDAWFGRACHRDPAHRFDAARVQIDALAEALGVGSAVPVAFTTGIRSAAVPSSARRRIVVPALLGATAAVFAITSGLATREARTSKASLEPAAPAAPEQETSLSRPPQDVSAPAYADVARRDEGAAPSATAVSRTPAPQSEERAARVNARPTALTKPRPLSPSSAAPSAVVVAAPTPHIDPWADRL